MFSQYHSFPQNQLFLITNPFIDNIPALQLPPRPSIQSSCPQYLKSNYNHRMAFDFFNEGFKQEPAIQFTKEEDQFLNSKLTFLDPKKTETIAIGTVISLFNLSKIGGANIKKIIQNCKIEGKKTISYEEMKRAFRGVSLVQKGVEPSAININANIKLAMPRFYDDDEDQEEEEPQRPVEKEQKSVPVQQTQPLPSKSPKASTVNADFAQFAQFPQTQKPPTQPTQPQKPPQPQIIPPPQRLAPQPQPTNNKLRQFQANWTKLNLKQNKIDGNEVKSLCKNLAQRSNLSKAWKICSKTHSGSLTKGQFYVFLELVGLNQLPQALTEEMKAIIAHIDRSNTPHKEKEKVLSNSQLAPPQVFDNFNKSQISINVPNPPTQRPTNQPPIQRPSNILPFTELSTKVTSKLQQASKSLKAEEQASAQQLLQLRRQQQTMNNMMGEVQQYLMMVNTKNNKVRAEIDELKNNQNSLNQRFNKVCMAMNQIISRQNAFIDQLMQEIATQNSGNQQKMTILEAYVADRSNHCERVQEEHRHRPSVGSNEAPKEVIPEKSRPSERVEEPAVAQYPYDERDNSPQPKQELESPVRQQQPPSQTTIPQQPQRRSIQQPQQQPQVSQQEIQYMNRMKMKQMQVIQLIHYLTPISQEQYPKIAQKITAYTEEQLNYAYGGLYEKLMEKKRLEELAEKSQGQQRPKPGEDQFNTSNFKNQEQKPAQGQDFFS